MIFKALSFVSSESKTQYCNEPSFNPISCEKCFMLSQFWRCTKFSECRTHVMLVSWLDALSLLKFVDNVESG